MLLVLLVTLLSSAIVGWLLVRYSSLPGNTGAWGHRRALRRQWQRWRKIAGGYPHGGVYAVSAGTVCGWRVTVLVTRLILGDSAAANRQQVIGFRCA